MQKTVKTGFRGERKRILTPSLSQGEGECWDGKAEETSPFSHTPLSQDTYPAVAGYLQRGNVGTEKGECGDQRGVVKGFEEVGRNQMGTSYKLALAIGAIFKGGV